MRHGGYRAHETFRSSKKITQLVMRRQTAICEGSSPGQMQGRTDRHQQQQAEVLAQPGLGSGGPCRPIFVNQALDLGPNLRVALDGGVSRKEMPGQPRVLAAFRGRFLVVKEKIVQDLCVCRVGSRNPGTAVEQAVSLVEVDRPGHIHGNHPVILPWLSNAIDLNGKQHRNAFPLQLAGQRNHRRPTPTVSEQDNARATLFLVRKVPVLVGIQPAENGSMRRLPLPVSKGSDTEMIRVRSPQLLRQLYLGMAGIIMVDESADETNDDQGRGAASRGGNNRL